MVFIEVFVSKERGLFLIKMNFAKSDVKDLAEKIRVSKPHAGLHLSQK